MWLVLLSPKKHKKGDKTLLRNASISYLEFKILIIRRMNWYATFSPSFYLNKNDFLRGQMNESKMCLRHSIARTARARARGSKANVDGMNSHQLFLNFQWHLISKDDFIRCEQESFKKNLLIKTYFPCVGRCSIMQKSHCWGTEFLRVKCKNCIG